MSRSAQAGELDFMAATTTVELSYAPRPRRRSRRRVALFSVLIVLAVTAVVTRKWEKAAWQQGVYLYWQHRCMTYTAPADKIVYEDDPVAATRLIATGANYYPPGRLLFNESWWPTPPRSWRPPALYAAPELDHVSISPIERAGTLFIHERSTIGGVRKLVVVWIGCASFGPNGHGLVVSGEAITPARFAFGSTMIREPYGPYICVELKSSDHLQLFAGRPDQKDASRFAIAYLLNGKPGVISGELMDAGHWRHDKKAETVRLHLTDGPLLPRLLDVGEGRDWQ
ncbi:MAG TPA: hypothetical protein VFE47_08155 [Tepidisphaeraceae bacterium]|nr:hypothetical protein [Tepidisphaeraceae bacterium]